MKNIFRFRAIVVEYPMFVVIVFAILTIIYLWGNYYAPQGTVIPDDAIMDSENSVRKMDDYVSSKKEYGFNPGETVIFPLNFGQSGIDSVEKIKKVFEWSSRLEKTLGDGVISIANIPEFVDNGGDLRGDPYINSSMLADGKYDVNAWKNRVTLDPSVVGVFVSRDPKMSMAYIYYYVDSDTDEMKEVWKIKEVVEQKKFGWIDRFWELDIHPVDPVLRIAGWIAGRWIMHQALIINILAIVVGGIIFVAFGFKRALGSGIQATISITIILLSVIWARGSIGILSYLGFNVTERVYALLSYAVCIFQGVSFTEQKFHAYNEAREEGKAIVEAWMSTITIDRLLTRLMAMSAGSFAVLGLSFGVRPIVDMAVVSGLGVVYLWIFTRYLLPAMYLWLLPKYLWIKTRLFKHADGGEFEKVSQFGQAITWIFIGLPLRFSLWWIRRVDLKIAGACSIVLVAVTTAWVFYQIVWPRQNLIIRSKPLEFIPNTLVHKTSKELNRLGYLGFDGFNFLIEPTWTASEGIYDPRFIAMVHQASVGIAAMSKEYGIHEMYSVVNTLERISQQSFRKPLPTTTDELGMAFLNISYKLSFTVRSASYYHNGIRLVITTNADDSNDMAALRKAVIWYVEKNFPHLRINAFGKAQVYPEVDVKIRVGKIWNWLGDQSLFTFVFLVWLVGVWRRRKEVGRFIRPVEGALIMNAPIWFATMSLSLIMVYQGIALDLATSAISALTINATGDFTFYLLKAFQDELKDKESKEAMISALVRKGPAIIEDAFLNTRCFLPLWFSSFLPIQRIGFMMVAMLLLCLFGVLVLLPSLLALVVKESKSEDIETQVVVEEACA